MDKQGRLAPHEAEALRKCLLSYRAQGVRHELDDVRQEILLAFWRAQPIATVEHAYVIARSALVDYWRAMRRERHRPVLDAVSLEWWDHPLVEHEGFSRLVVRDILRRLSKAPASLQRAAEAIATSDNLAEAGQKMGVGESRMSQHRKAIGEWLAEPPPLRQRPAEPIKVTANIRWG